MKDMLTVGLAGLGTVGVGVVRLLASNADLLADRAGRPIRLTAVSARDRARERGVDLAAFAFEEDPVALAARPDVDVVVELIGGADGPALALARATLAAGRPLVTANKAMIAHHGAELARAAEDAGVTIGFEAAVAGAIPVIRGLREGAAANRIGRVAGILNGTCNYILSGMEREGLNFETVLASAQQAGFAEADPGFDIDGIDAAHKLAILAAIAFGTSPDFAAVAIQGIRDLGVEDIRHAATLGYRIRLVGLAEPGLAPQVTPALVPLDHPLAAVHGALNAVAIEGDACGRLFFSGAGAGAGPTASAVVADLVDIARGPRPGPVFAVPAHRNGPSQATGARRGRFYLRLEADDRPGVLADLTAVLRDEGVSIGTMVQPPARAGEAARILSLIHI
jgi:homoserine dehydrogenase